MTEQKLSDLREEIQAANMAYAAGKPYMSDTDYDELWQKLHSLNPHDSLLYHTGQNPNLAANYRSHKHPILGTQKAFETFDLRLFLTRFAGKLLVLEPKYDGLAAVLYRDSADSLLLVLEGDGRAGADITRHLPYIELPFAPSSMESVEIVIPLSRWKPSLGANPRAAAIGLVGRTDISDASGILQIVSHNRGPLSDVTHLSKADDVTHEKLLGLYDSWSQEYPIDGIMLKPADHDERLKAGHNGSVSLWSVAWKPPIQIAETTCVDVEWKVSRKGRVVPTAIYQPVELCGTTNRRATANNAQWLMERNIRSGTTLTIGKAGEIIPKILNKPLALTRAKLPLRFCPYCGYELSWQGKHLVCDSQTCLPQIVMSLEHFYGKFGMDLKEIGERRLYAMLQNETLHDKLTKYPWYLLTPGSEGFDLILSVIGEGAFEQYRRNLTELARRKNRLHFMAALGLPDLTYKAARKCYMESTHNQAPGRLAKDARQSYVEAYVALEKALTDGLRFDFGPLPTIPDVVYTITGKLSVPRDDMIEYLAKHNWEFRTTVTGEYDLIIVGDLIQTSKKWMRAKELGVQMIDEFDIKDYIKKGEHADAPESQTNRARPSREVDDPGSQ